MEKSKKEYLLVLFTYFVLGLIKLYLAAVGESYALFGFAVHSFVVVLMLFAFLFLPLNSRGLFRYTCSCFLVAVGLFHLFAAFCMNTYFVSVLRDAARAAPNVSVFYVSLVLGAIYLMLYFRFRGLSANSVTGRVIYTFFGFEAIAALLVLSSAAAGFYGHAIFDVIVALGICLQIKRLSLEMCMEGLSCVAAREMPGSSAG